MIRDVMVIDGQPTSWKDALEFTFLELFKSGYVKKSFLHGCIERELSFPTGLATVIPVAIPHTDAIHVKSPAICVLRLGKPVEFKNMAEPNQVVKAEFIFTLALDDDKDQISMLKTLIQIIKDGVFLNKAKTMECADFKHELQELLGFAS
jgi:galactitol PTS system EIIA component